MVLFAISLCPSAISTLFVLLLFDYLTDLVLCLFCQSPSHLLFISLSVINVENELYSLIAETIVCSFNVARLSHLKPVRGLEDDQAEMSETIGQC